MRKSTKIVALDIHQDSTTVAIAEILDIGPCIHILQQQTGQALDHHGFIPFSATEKLNQ